jgi:hypothetical protein
LTPELTAAVQKYIIDYVEGGISSNIISLIDEAIYDAYITTEQFTANERDILDMIDEHIFECEHCGWVLPISRMSNLSVGEQLCNDCLPDNGEEE